MTDTVTFPYSSIPSFPKSTVAGHKGELGERKDDPHGGGREMGVQRRLQIRIRRISHPDS